MSPGHKSGRGHFLDLTAAPHPRRRGRRLAERLECPFAAVFGDDVGADDREQRDQDEQPVANLAEGDRDDAGDDEQDDERLGDGPKDEARQRRSRRRLEIVRAGRRRSSRRFLRCQAATPVDPEGSRHRIAVAGVGIGGRIGREAVPPLVRDARPDRHRSLLMVQRRTIGRVIDVRPVTIHADRAAGRLDLVWEDGHETSYDTVALRWLCPCAFCRGEAGMPGWLDSAPTLTAEQTRLVDVAMVGGYAIAPTWGDGHHTGYYTFTLLRDRCPCPECTARRDAQRPVAPAAVRHEEHA